MSQQYDKNKNKDNFYDKVNYYESRNIFSSSNEVKANEGNFKAFNQLDASTSEIWRRINSTKQEDSTTTGNQVVDSVLNSDIKDSALLNKSEKQFGCGKCGYIGHYSYQCFNDKTKSKGVLLEEDKEKLKQLEKRLKKKREKSNTDVDIDIDIDIDTKAKAVKEKNKNKTKGKVSKEESFDHILSKISELSNELKQQQNVIIKKNT